jgi:formylmethanofuran dehydrogenase subunit E
MNITDLLEKSMQDHDHLCPRQILGVRIGMAGMKTLGFAEPPKKKELLVITETDGCFVDGVIAATGCTVGHRTLRVEDYGKVAVTFVDTKTGRAVRVSPALDVREKAYAYADHEPRHYFAQLQAYQIIPDDELLTIREVALRTPVKDIISRPGVRANCDVCGEEVINDRQIQHDGLNLCRSCAGEGYYHSSLTLALNSSLVLPVEQQL